MPEKKPYDSTLARMAGNIAGSIVGAYTSRDLAYSPEDVANESLDLAWRIVRNLTSKTAPQRHGIDCPKVQHIGEGYLHEYDNDSPYDVDGVLYCGRCHGFMERV